MNELLKGAPPVMWSADTFRLVRVRGNDSHLFLSLNLNDLAVVDNDFDGAIPNAFDRLKKCGPNIRTGFVGMYVHVFHDRLRTPSLPHDHLLALIPIPEE